MLPSERRWHNVPFNKQCIAAESGPGQSPAVPARCRGPPGARPPPYLVQVLRLLLRLLQRLLLAACKDRGDSEAREGQRDRGPVARPYPLGPTWCPLRRVAPRPRAHGRPLPSWPRAAAVALPPPLPPEAPGRAAGRLAVPAALGGGCGGAGGSGRAVRGEERLRSARLGSRSGRARRRRGLAVEPPRRPLRPAGRPLCLR